MAQKEDPKSNIKKHALGKGFSSLLGLDEISTNSVSNASLSQSNLNQTQIKNSNKSSNLNDEIQDKAFVLDLPINKVEPNPNQPRKIFDENSLKELSESIKLDGVVQPIIVSKVEKNGRYTIIAGERRWRASKLAGLDVIPAIVKDGTSQDLLRVSLIENIQRQDLNAVEEAEAYDRLIKDYGLTQEQCAKQVGKDRASVANTLRLLSLPKEVQDDLVEYRLTPGHAKALLSLEDKKLILRARDIVVSKELNVRQTEQLCKSMLQNLDNPTQESESQNQVNPDLEYLCESLRSILKTKVKISGSGSKGRIEISFFTPSDLERIISQLGIYTK